MRQLLISKIILLILLIVPLTIWADDATKKNEKYFSLVEDADNAISEGNWALAQEYLQQAMRLDPSNPTNVLLLSNLGMVQFYDGRSDEAIATLTNAHNIAPKSVTVLMNRARIYTSTNQHILASADYSTVIHLDSTMIEPRFYRAMLSLNAGKLDEAKTDIDTLIIKAPDDHRTNIAQATLLMTIGEYQKAIPYLSTVIKNMPDASYYGHRALCYLQTNDLSSATEDISNGLSLDPTDPELYIYRAMLNKMRYRPDDAKADAETAIKFGANPHTVKALIGH